MDYLPTITRPDKILCVGLNYKSHQEETGRGGEGYPTIFVRFAAAQVGHEQPMIRPVESNTLDFEGEIALVIGKAGRRIKREKALDHVAGFGIYNDGSVREYQRQTSQFTPGKNFAATGGFGPWMMTPDEVGDPQRLEITTRLNGEVMQNATAHGTTTLTWGTPSSLPSPVHKAARMSSAPATTAPPPPPSFLHFAPPPSPCRGTCTRPGPRRAPSRLCTAPPRRPR